jgi:hypothetical protein
VARRWPGLCATFLLLGFSPVSFAQPADAAPPPGYTPAPANPAPIASPANQPYPADLYGPAPEAPPVSAPPASNVAVVSAPAPENRRPYSLGVTLANSMASETNSTSFVTSPLLEGAYAVHRHVLVDLTLGFGWMIDNQGLGESTFRAGNPMLSGYYRDEAGPWRFQLGIGVTAPLAHVSLGPDGRLYESLYNRTLAAWGMWNQWLWLTDRMAMPLTLRAGYTFPCGTELAVEVADAWVFGVRGEASGTDLIVQEAIEVRIPIGLLFTLTPRFQTVLLPSASMDRWQSAAGLRGTLATKAGRFFAGFLVNLDEPLVAAGSGARWGFQLGKEVDL